MKSENTTPIRVTLLSATFLRKKNNFNQLLTNHVNKLSFLLLSILGFSAFANNETSLSNHLAFKIKQVNDAKTPHEKGAVFLINLYETSIKSPNKTKDFVTKTTSFWLDTYPLKSAFLLLGKAEVAQSNGTFANTINNTLQAIKIIEASEETPSKKKILCMAYLAYARYTQFTKEKKGIDYGYTALQIAETINFPMGEVMAHDLIGTLIGYFNKDYQLALKHYQEAEILLPKLSPDRIFLKHWVLGNIAKAWSDLGDIEKSIDYKLKFLADSISNENLLLLIAVYNNLGTNYFDLKKFDEAEKTLQKTIDLMEQHKVLYHLGVPLLRMGLIKLEQKDLIQAIYYSDAIDYWLIDHKYIGNYQVSFYQFKSKIAKAKKDYEQAIFWIEKASIEQDSINQIAGVNHLIKLEKNVKLKEIRQEQLILEKELALNKATINTQNIILLAISFITILSIWFGLSFYEKTRELKEAYNFILRKNSLPTKIKAPVVKEKNNNSNTNKKINEVLKEKIIHALEVDKIFLSPDLTLKKFSDQLSSNTSYVSQTINEGCRKNFSTLINEYRIKEVLHFFEEGQHQLFTIESLYKKAGFKSKSAFQKAFKNSQGVTASYYLEHISKFSNSDQHS